ncbi:uncharacterized protein LOC126901433 isoform X1 [Daktulosphaira vitifoliae]|uniref:uncharacterized protein LOC126901433 isoform X1 n=1 Tax=Daktulosphaira vitifoliae TaxID=58002 RepID=UPI0021AB086A|nr:uncharacterized protein LOC126901433 isoform X1 [Daktulosphaira vitifoliae]XP_050533825.1 uncharacterized protein LOC126901433 isoform X1 [Daktulosphaira vitifoliae]XP_050533826.1 uncharacterized protein LOC126901433 isoform X1 [Daktulosphaira vitifoliae]
MNIRGVASTGNQPNRSTSYSLGQLDINQTLSILYGHRSIRTGPSPVANNGKYWTPNKRRENAETVKYIKQVVQACKIAKPWTDERASQTISYTHESKIKLDQLPQVMQKILRNRIKDKNYQDIINQWDSSEFVNDCLFWHNFYRRFHGSPNLILSSNLCQHAQDLANYLAHTDTFAYQNQSKYGQSLFCRKLLDFTIETNGKEVVRHWYSSSKVFKPRKNSSMFSANINSGPFTQLVWRDTKYLGVGRACNKLGKEFIVANYLPKGNINGQYLKNVHINKLFTVINQNDQ